MLTSQMIDSLRPWINATISSLVDSDLVRETSSIILDILISNSELNDEDLKMMLECELLGVLENQTWNFAQQTIQKINEVRCHTYQITDTSHPDDEVDYEPDDPSNTPDVPHESYDFPQVTTLKRLRDSDPDERSVRPRTSRCHHNPLLTKAPIVPHRKNVSSVEPIGKSVKSPLPLEASNTKLSLSNIPVELFTIRNLLNHFEPFGLMLSISLFPPDSATVEFMDPDDALKALNSPKAVCDNRFIQLNVTESINVQNERGKIRSRGKPPFRALKAARSNRGRGGFNQRNFDYNEQSNEVQTAESAEEVAKRIAEKRARNQNQNQNQNQNTKVEAKETEQEQNLQRSTAQHTTASEKFSQLESMKRTLMAKQILKQKQLMKELEENKDNWNAQKKSQKLQEIKEIQHQISGMQ